MKNFNFILILVFDNFDENLRNNIVEFGILLHFKNGYLLGSLREVEACISRFYFHSFGSLCLLSWTATACNSTRIPIPCELYVKLKP
jgi:hypothetical protein